jgi:hypothetical protein
MVSLKNTVVLNFRSYTESHETTAVQQPFHVTLYMTSNLNNDIRL